MSALDNIAALFDGSGKHPCTHPGCERVVEYDDEPWCFTHSPDSGSSVTGYSFKRDHP